MAFVVRLAQDPPWDGDTSGHPFVTNDAANSHYPFSDGIIYDTFGTTVRKTVGDPAPALTNAHIYIAISAASDWRSYLNGTLLFSTATNAVSFDVIPRIGESSADGPAVGVNDYYLNGWLAALFVYDRARLRRSQPLPAEQQA